MRLMVGGCLIYLPKNEFAMTLLYLILHLDPEGGVVSG